ncbi:LysR substrate-binding domain-containing protein [Spartinivicinus poritis]|uniref:LysR substrate-binding domain-containing protein n=1 Tax=Spartinivicinus poritis TaxID=2994640 RepID=A0ABT5U699_9GAMM|nr:LysR substrate-binding domain-containing protein [Spartinivicinus sp. A2-2]MDE1461890.1 LysR substrate-binding domain-containing protein [Spartinivicinus sp. A2-2]
MHKVRLTPTMLSRLAIFEVAANELSFTKAAELLFVTQSAVSHQIKALEADLNIPLFVRKTRKLILTKQGELLAQAVRHSLLELRHTLKHLSSVVNNRLVISCTPSFASRCLLPRLSEFQQLHQDVEVVVVAEARSVDLHKEDVDVCIRIGYGDYSGLLVTRMTNEVIMPVCSPVLLKELKRPLSLKQLKKLPLIVENAQLWDIPEKEWSFFFQSFGMDSKIASKTRYSHSYLVLEAVISGQGVALSQSTLVRDALKHKILVKPVQEEIETTAGYFLLSRPDHENPQLIESFKEWLIKQVNFENISGVTA